MSTILVGDCRDVLATLDAGSVQTCVTSPPYFGLRDYGHDGQIGLEETPEEFVATLVGVFSDVRRVLADDGTLWLNLGDSYGRGFGGGTPGEKSASNAGSFTGRQYRGTVVGVKDKDLVGIPWMVAFGLRADGWYLRSDIIWAKPNPMPESVTDRPTSAHEHIFLLAKSPRYFYDADAIRDSDNGKPSGNGFVRDHRLTYEGRGNADEWTPGGGRNKRNVWTVPSTPYAGAHFATFPPKLIEPCIRAGSREGDTVLDPFNGAGTTGLVAQQNGRSYIGIELNPEYAALTRDRLAGVNEPLPGLAA